MRATPPHRYSAPQIGIMLQYVIVWLLSRNRKKLHHFSGTYESPTASTSILTFNIDKPKATQTAPLKKVLI
jgi:hypothetical protein